MGGIRVIEDPKISYSFSIPKLSKNEIGFVDRFLEKTDSVDELPTQLMAFAETQEIFLESTQIERIEKYIEAIMDAQHIFRKPLNDSSVEEIAIIGIGKPAYVYLKEKGWVMADMAIDDEAAFMEIVNRLARQSGKRITRSTPYLNANIGDCLGRLHATLPPISNHELTIRKFNSKPYSIPEFTGPGIVDRELGALLWMLVQADCSMIISGNTASGKTSLLNALTQLFTGDERVVVIEETRELNIGSEHCVFLTQFGETTMKQLIWDSLRMRPDRLIIGEVRSQDEAMALMESVLAGQARSFYSTMHANSAAEIPKRLHAYGIPHENLAVIDCIINIRRFREFSRNGITEKRELHELLFPSNKLRIRCSGKTGSKELGTEMFESLDESILFRLERIGIGNANEFTTELTTRAEFIGKYEHNPENFTSEIAGFYRRYGNGAEKDKEP